MFWGFPLDTKEEASSAGIDAPEICDERTVILGKTYKAKIRECLYPETFTVSKGGRGFYQGPVEARSVHQEPISELGGEC